MTYDYEIRFENFSLYDFSCIKKSTDPILEDMSIVKEHHLQPLTLLALKS